MAHFRTQQGFTLLEVLVCLVIIVILAALMLPASSSSERPMGPKCMNNQRQITLAAIIYQSDRKELPNLDSTPGNDGPLALSLLTNYLHNQTNLFMCPFIVRQRERDRTWNQPRFVPELNVAFFRSNGNDYAYYDGAPTNGLKNAVIADRLAWTNRLNSNLWASTHIKGVSMQGLLTVMSSISKPTGLSERTTVLRGHPSKTQFFADDWG